MIYIVPLIWLGTAALAWHTWRRHPDKFAQALKGFARTARLFLGVVPLALVAAGFLTPLVPGDLVGRLLGDSAGLTGILIAVLIGFCLPVQPPIFFPLVAVLLGAGAGFPQLTALIASWNVFAAHRTLGIELPIMGRYFVILRILASLAILPLAGLIAIPVTEWLGFGS